MKLRLRSIDSKETLKIEFPNSCTLSQFKQILSQTLLNSPPPASIRLSLNRKDDLQSDGEDSLQSLGIAAGDLVFFSVQHPPADFSPNPQIFPSPETNSTPKPGSRGSDCSTSLNTQNTPTEVNNPNSANFLSQKRETLDEMDVDDETLEGGYVTDKYFSVPGFLRKVFMTELSDDGGRNHKLIIIAIHAVMLDSGFVGFDKKTNTVVSGSRLPNEWPSDLFRMSLFYTLPNSSGISVNNVVLKFQSLGKFINVYGSLGKRGTYRVQLNEDQLVPFLNVVWADCGEEDVVGLFDTSPEKEVFKFWRDVKDNLALPLLIDLCEESGLELPPCFTRLPTDLKLKILEYVSGVDLAKVSCVSSELRYLASSDDLWRLKFVEEFGDREKHAWESWKQGFENAWDSRKKRVRDELAIQDFRAAFRRRGRYRNPLMVPWAPRMGGDEIGDRLLLPRILHGYDPRRRNFPSLGVRGGGRFV